MYSAQDNIVALATIPGKSALNVIRCSGQSCLLLYKKLFKQKKDPKPNYVQLRTAFFDGKIIDKCMVTFYKNPKSYTGENMLEISSHGGSVIAMKIIQAIESMSFRSASPGEFTYRSFINGKMNLAQAEFVQTAIDSKNSLDSFFSIKNIEGAFSAQIDNISSEIKSTLTYMEHELDFSESEIDFETQEAYIQKINKAIDLIEKTKELSYMARDNKSSVLISLVGKTNVGKSSLFNKILGYERSIVTNKKGTTRDTVEADFIINNINVKLVDTAGIRKTKEIVEKEGISRTYKTIQDSDIVIFVDDSSPIKNILPFSKIIQNKKTLLVKSKSDLKGYKKEKSALSVSSKSEEGLKTLINKLNKEVAQYKEKFIDSYMFLINNRQRNILNSASKHLKDALVSYKNTNDIVVLSSYLRTAYEKLCEIQGYKDKDEIINTIFKGFCVGK